MLIEINGLTKSYSTNRQKNTVFRDMNFSLGDHEFLAIKGKSGCGKSTLLRIIGLMDSFEGGEYKFCGNDIKRLSDKKLSELRNRYIGFVFQNFNLIPEYTILENLELPLGYAGICQAERKRRAVEMLEKFDLTNKLNAYPNQLSGGQQQRVAIARALINNPKVILADEPTGNLDSDNTAAVMRLFTELYQGGISIVVVTHDDLTASFAERTMILPDGV